MDLKFKHRSVCKEESTATVRVRTLEPGHLGLTGSGWSQDLNPGAPLVSEGLVVSGLGVHITEMEAPQGHSGQLGTEDEFEMGPEKLRDPRPEEAPTETDRSL